MNPQELEHYLNELTAALKACIPNLNTQVMLDTANHYFGSKDYAGYDDDDILLSWLYDNLEKKNLITYKEWKQYWGELPKLQALNSLDIHDKYDPEPIYKENLNYDIFPENPPYLEHMSYFLQPHGLIMGSFAFENLYIMCLQDDKEALQKLESLLIKMDIELIVHEPLNNEECIEYFKECAENSF